MKGPAEHRCLTRTQAQVFEHALRCVHEPRCFFVASYRTCSAVHPCFVLLCLSSWHRHAQNSGTLAMYQLACSKGIKTRNNCHRVFVVVASRRSFLCSKPFPMSELSHQDRAKPKKLSSDNRVVLKFIHCPRELQPLGSHDNHHCIARLGSWPTLAT